MHVPRLRAEELPTDREPVIMQAADGTIVEVLAQMRVEYSRVCDYVPIAETGELFSKITALCKG